MPSGRCANAAGDTMGGSCDEGIDLVCVVDAVAYRACPHARRPDVARAVGAAGRIVREQGASAVLLAPGRIGTSSPDLGLPMTFAETAPFAAIVKHVDVAYGFSPELSYGSHMFQDLVEKGILYCAALEKPSTSFDLGALGGLPEVPLPLDEGGPRGGRLRPSARRARTGPPALA
ncbi:MAG: hypothetical protein LKH08_00430 [Atopobiaceae bacterium]|nr:hypothetical protein [Atopobiaceae bacterium]MCH4120114.1 hypothetical protein [Atopobiaceae bacterium]MCI1388370.1 hypothetical protein [Atopobiaceae bacterium]MCI1431380.1 hypothetical protein [Atopobiaceae bacterium]MCI1469816.1 hypothetical protein [Atopobiaceae bacterium]